MQPAGKLAASESRLEDPAAVSPSKDAVSVQPQEGERGVVRDSPHAMGRNPDRKRLNF
jgi:hypothetical protein